MNMNSLLQNMSEAMDKAMVLMNEAKDRAKAVARDQEAMDALVEEFNENCSAFEDYGDACDRQEAEQASPEGKALLLKIRVSAYALSLASQHYMVCVREKKDEGLAVPRLTKIPRHLRVQTAIIALATIPYVS